MPIDNLESVHGLSPLQEGLLFHALYAPDAGLYLSQSVASLDGALDVPTFKAAWATTIDRHAVLRTSFHWEGVEKPLQAVHRRVELVWTERDLSAHAEPDQQRVIDDYLAADVRRGFDPSSAPLVRCALFRTREDRHEFALTTHHLVLDGWSRAIVLRDVFRTIRSTYRRYDRRSSGQPAVLRVRAVAGCPGFGEGEELLADRARRPSDHSGVARSRRC